MKRCPQCKNLMPDDVFQCVQCGHDSSKDIPPTTPTPATAQLIQQRLSGRIRGINWLRVCAAVFSSKLFFLASCTGGMIASGLLEDSDDYGPATTDSRPAPGLASVIATIPDAERQGQRKAVVVFLSTLDDFKSKNPDYSFLLPAGNGKVDNPAAEMWTKYSVTASEPGKVIVKSHFYHDVPLTGIDVRQRYEATDKSVTLLNAKFGFGYGEALVLGLAFATALAITGRILKRRMAPTTPPLSAAELAAAKSAATKRTLKIFIVAIVIGLLLPALIIILFGG